MGGRRLWALARPGLAGLLDVCGVRTRSLSSLVCKPRANRGASLQGGGKAGTVATDRKRGRGGWQQPAMLGTRSLAALGTGVLAAPRAWKCGPREHLVYPDGLGPRALL